MIDTNKYEGHTEGEWDLHSMGDGWTIGQLRKIDRTLMQDAPLLLAEVKRLQYWDEEMDRVIATLDEHSWGSSDGDVHEIVTHLLAEVKRLREEVKMLWQYVDTELMYTDGLLTVEGEMIE
jgi:hypothetical protein